MSKNLALIIAVLLGLLAVGLIYTYLKNIETKMTQGMEMQRILVANDDLPAGAKLSDQNVSLRQYPEKYVAGRAITPDAAESVVGSMVKFNIEKGKPIFWSDIVAPEVLDEGIAGDIQPNMNAMTLPVSAVSGLAGMLKPGMHVDVLFTVDSSLLLDTDTGMTAGAPQDITNMKEAIATSRTSSSARQDTKATVLLFQNILVLAVDSKRGADMRFADQAQDAQDKMYTTITVMVTPKQARILTFCMNQGQINLTLRRTGDTAIDKEAEVVTFDVVHDYLTRDSSD